MSVFIEIGLPFIHFGNMLFQFRYKAYSETTYVCVRDIREWQITLLKYYTSLVFPLH